MKIKKAVITAAGKGTRHYPATSAIRKELFPLVDKDGITRTVIHLIVQEALDSGIEEVCIVTDPGGDIDFRRYFHGLSPDEMPRYSSKPWALEISGQLKDMEERITYAVQKVQDGYGHAVYCSREFVGDEPFLLLLGDHVYVSQSHKRCTSQLLNTIQDLEKSAAAVQRTPESLLPLYGTAAGKPLSTSVKMYEITEMREKPSADYARANLQTPGLPPDTYLCFFGIQCLTPPVFDCLEYHIRNDIREKGEIQLTSSMEMLRRQEGFLAVEIDGQRYDVGVPEGYLNTIIALSRQSSYEKV